MVTSRRFLLFKRSIMQRKHFFIVEEQSDLDLGKTGTRYFMRLSFSALHLVADMEILRMGCHAALKLTAFTVYTDGHHPGCAAS